MNQSILLVKIIEDPQSFYLDNEILVVEVLICFQLLTNQKVYNFGIAVFWGNLANTFLQYYKKNDYIILEGTLSVQKNFFDNMYDLKVTVSKLHPFLFNDE